MRQIPLPLNKSAMEVIYKGQFQTFFLEKYPVHAQIYFEVSG